MISTQDWRAKAASLRAVAALRANADRIKGPWPPRDAAQAAAAFASAAVDAASVAVAAGARRAAAVSQHPKQTDRQVFGDAALL